MRTPTWMLYPIVSLILLMASSTQAQYWDTITPAGWNTTRVAYAGGDIWAASSGGLLHVDLDIYDPDGAFSGMEILDEDEDLFSNSINVISTDPFHDMLWVGHANGGIDIIDPESGEIVQRILDFYHAPDVYEIYDIDFHGNYGFVATDVGLSLLGYESEQGIWFVQDTFRGFGSWNRPVQVDRIEVHNDTVWVGCANGAAFGSLNTNLLDASNWTTFDLYDDIPVGPDENNPHVNLIRSVGNDVYVSSYRYGIYRYTLSGFVQADNNLSLSYYGFIQAADGTAYASMWGGLFHGDSPESDNWEQVGDWEQKMSDVIETPNGDLWVALDSDLENYGGIGHYSAEYGWTILKPNAPGGIEILAIEQSPDDEIWLTARKPAVSGVYALQDGSWNSWTYLNLSLYFWSYNSVAIGFDKNNHVWVGSRGHGLLYFDSIDPDTVFMINAASDDFAGEYCGGTSATGEFTLITDFATDPSTGGMWFCNPEAHDGKSICYIEPEWIDNWRLVARDYWHRFGSSQGLDERFISNMEIDSRNRLWLSGGSDATAASRTLICFNPNGTPLNTEDDVYHEYRSTDIVGADAHYFYDMIIDSNDILWLGGPGGLFWVDTRLENVYGTKVRGAVGSTVYALAEDPHGHIWVGTDFGVSVLNSDRFTWLRHYTSETGPHPSPLADDKINALAFDWNTGEAYIGTSQGLSVLATPFREFGEDLGSVEVRPQPFFVGPNETMNLTFVGESLVAGAQVRFFTPSGRLVRNMSFDEASFSGWDGRDDDGDYVASGIYLIVVTDPEGNSETGKTAVVRR